MKRVTVSNGGYQAQLKRFWGWENVGPVFRSEGAAWDYLDGVSL